MDVIRSSLSFHFLTRHPVYLSACRATVPYRLLAPSPPTMGRILSHRNGAKLVHFDQLGVELIVKQDTKTKVGRQALSAKLSKPQ